MTEFVPSPDEISTVYSKLVEIIADALGCEAADVVPTCSLIDDLDAESIDFLDIIFRLEKEFKIKLPRGKIIENSRGSLSESEFEDQGVLTSAGLNQLKSYLNEVPSERFNPPIYVADIPRLFTPETFMKLVIQAQRDQNDHDG